LLGTNTLAYLASSSATNEKKSFITLIPAWKISTRTSTQTHFAYKVSEKSLMMLTPESRTSSPGLEPSAWTSCPPRPSATTWTGNTSQSRRQRYTNFFSSSLKLEKAFQIWALNYKTLWIRKIRIM
jgi:hypothetical protein